MSQFPGSLLLSINLESLDPRDSHDVLCVLRHYEAAAMWKTPRIDHAWLLTVHNTVNQEIGLLWDSATANQQMESSVSIGIPISALVIDRMSQVRSFTPPANDLPAICIETRSADESCRPLRISPVSNHVCEVPISCGLPKSASIWTSRLAKKICRTIRSGKSIHIDISQHEDTGPAIADRLERILKVHSTQVRSIRATAQAALRSRLGVPSRSILRPVA